MAIDRDGAVYQTTIIASGTENGEPQGDLWRDELWIYPDEQQARHLFHLSPPGTDDIPAQTIFVIDDNRIHSQHINGTTDVRDVDMGQLARTCPLVDVTIFIHHITSGFCSRFVPQEGEADELTARIDENAEFEGQPAVALVYEARNEIEPGTTPEPERLPELTVASFYLSPDDWLPLGWTVEMIDEPTDSEIVVNASYTHQFIPREQLPVDFFASPAAGQPTEDAP